MQRTLARNMFRIGVILGCVFAMFAQNSWAASIIIQPPDDNQTVNVGDTFTITIIGLGFDNGSKGGGLDITWDPSIISLVSTDNIDTSPFPGDQIFGSPGTLTSGFLQDLSVSSLFEGAEGPDFTIAVLTFTAIAAGDTSIDLALGTFTSGLGDDVWTDIDSMLVDLQPGDFSGAMISVVEAFLSDITGLVDISGDGVPDIAQLRPTDRPKVRYFSGASRGKIKTVSYLGPAWSGVAIATVADGNEDGVADDPAVALLANKASDNKHVVEVRRANDGSLVSKHFFLGTSWDIIDVAVIDDADGDGVTGDNGIAVLGFNPNKAFDEQLKVQVRTLGTGTLVANWFFLNGNWTPLALEVVNRIGGQSPLLAVLANKAATGNNAIQARRLSDGAVQRDTSFFDSSWIARDVSILKDSNGDGNANDPAYLVLASDTENGRNKVQTRRVSDGTRLKNITMLGTNWDGSRVAGTGDISGNLYEEVGVLAEKRTDGTVAIQLKDYDDRTTTATIFP